MRVIQAGFGNNIRSRGLATAAVVCAVACLPAAVAGQAARSAPLRVVVVDPSGAKVPNAQVQVFQSRTQDDVVVKTLRTDRAGELLLTLPAGAYSLRIGATGFQDARQAVEIGTEEREPVVVRLRIAAKAETVNVASGETGDGSISDGQAIVLRANELAALSNDPTVLQQQINALVQTDDGSAPELRVDGFSNGRLPPKSAIREIRVNQNAYSAQFDQRGNSVVDVFTRPGGQKLQGSVYLSGNADPMNARNPFLPTAPSYQSTFLDANVNGPMGKGTSFFAGTTVNDLQNNAAVNASVLDANFNVVPFSQTVADPLLTRSANLRIDHQFGERNTLTARAEWSGTHQENGGLGAGELVLPSAGYTADSKTFALQVGNTTVASTRTVVESRFQYRRTWTEQTPNSTDPALVVQGAFTGGGSATQGLRDVLDNYEWQEYVSSDRGRHYLRGGVRYRLTRDSNTSTAAFNGQYTFASIEAYQTTVRGLAQGQTPAQIRAAGGGASQYNVTAGQPSAVISTGDLGVYFEDEWKVSQNFSLTSGLRYESQYGIPDHNDPAPRLGFALTVVGRKGTPLVRLRGGVGFFYDRFGAGNILTAARENGVLQQTVFLQNPDTFPGPPAPGGSGVVTFAAQGRPSTVYQIAPGFHSPYVLGEGVTAERVLFGGRASVSFTREHGTHQLLSRNANAPLNGVRPLGGSQNVYQFASLGTSDTTTLAPSYTRSFGSHGFVWVNYSFRFREAAGFGPGSFVSNSYDVSADYGRTPYMTRHRLFVGSSYNLPWNFSGTAFLSMHSATRFNVTTGQDNNGDSIFNDRPAFATDLSRPTVVRTAIGNFDTAPVAGQRVIPIDYGVAPGLVSVQGQFGREFIFGPRLAAEPTAPGAKPAPPDRFFHCFFGVQVQNLLNHVNRSMPIGQLSSPYFGRSLSLNAEQSQTTAANRVVNAFLSLRF
ncbi:TonB-dependent receptor [Terriglobus aquaticus]|uniref:Carboxypeptidase regulatory-like domain-containing protein n=1 Tax=Terriglobus aquaticus TaxID=940139 RepID=A0ABW9KJZ6_9BACT|nr:carboxypeptidase regulatory-like domain-containing protein [Terriglobus aquaticus]